MEILFVCTGNTCRSPLAEVILRNTLVVNKLEGITVSSAGTGAELGSPASAGSKSVLLESEDLKDHRARQVDDAILKEAGLVLTMTRAHKDLLQAQYPAEATKIYTLMGYSLGKDEDIPDPYGGSRDDYLAARAKIEVAVSGLVAKLILERGEGNGMKIALASDHGGFRLKEELKGLIGQVGGQYVDLGCDSEEAVDYPDYASLAAKAVARGQCRLGIIVCGTGVGMAIAANKVKGIRAAVCHDCFSAKMARAHNDANILALGQRVTGSGLALLIAREFIETPFEGGRHLQRLAKISLIEEEFGL